MIRDVRPEPATGDPKRDVYVFEAPVSIKREQGDDPVGFMDLYKKESFILEAKQGSTSTGKKIGTARRGTSGRHLAMHEARGQALKYATHVAVPPPFLMVCDIGYCFDIFATFDGTTTYREFPTPQAFRVYFKDFEKNAELFRRIFSDPLGLDPSKQSVKVTRDVAAQLAKLSRSLEADGHHPELVATFLMRCIFTMFAEDAGLLPDHLFTHLLKEYWIKNPPSFPGGVMGLWKEMNSGGHNIICGKILEFNGGLFRDAGCNGPAKRYGPKRKAISLVERTPHHYNGYTLGEIRHFGKRRYCECTRQITGGINGCQSTNGTCTTLPGQP